MFCVRLSDENKISDMLMSLVTKWSKGLISLVGVSVFYDISFVDTETENRVGWLTGNYFVIELILLLQIMGILFKN